ncbi:ABC transporter ATP-binding protein [Fervidibacillus halotolerans]|uniref:ABC transporter ATP-binding protein n=1 Tax=Fervidibacillus halotolerans TaxID=2980027 RepID=A0A9E8M237_9BACI|nr:ABC transporter ATP-binding protein [Fervidibacillus halotolerans]WAA12879.1 ABC transporter ATP-binding protein [Fervidibacillus halotolerans]
MEVLKVDNVSMKFEELTVLNHVSFSVPKHSAFGLIGKNGAGKTTTMKLIVGLLKPTGGKMTVCGEQVIYGNTKTNRLIGYLPDVPEFYGYLTPKEYLKLCGEITGLPSSQIKKKTEELLNLVGLEGVNRKIGSFSRGMKQRLGIAQALINEPKLLICDEPTSALDPMGRKEILDILRDVTKKTTVIFSSHILSDVEKVCDTIGILNQGQLLLQGNLSEMKENYSKMGVRMDFFNAKDAEEAEKVLVDLPFVFKLERLEMTLSVQLTSHPSNTNELLKIVSMKGWNLKKYELIEPSLEDVFLEVVKG